MPKPIEPKPNKAECERMIRAFHVGVLVMCDDSEPYAVPMNHAYRDGTLYFHCAPTGRKLDLIRANPHVCYVVNRHFGDPDALPTTQKCHGDWESVIARGTARVIEDREELRAAFETFGKYYDPQFQVSETALDTTSAIILAVASMTARREARGATVDYWSWARDESALP